MLSHLCYCVTSVSKRYNSITYACFISHGSAPQEGFFSYTQFPRERWGSIWVSNVRHMVWLAAPCSAKTPVKNLAGPGYNVSDLVQLATTMVVFLTTRPSQQSWPAGQTNHGQLSGLWFRGQQMAFCLFSLQKPTNMRRDYLHSEYGYPSDRPPAGYCQQPLIPVGETNGLTDNGSPPIKKRLTLFVA